MSSAPGDRSARPDVRLTPVRGADRPWLVAMGLDPELIGRQYHWAETPLQLLIAPLRAALGPHVAACTVWVDGRRAGYIGRSPLSGNYEDVLRPWARGGGVGRRMIADFLAHHRSGDQGRAFFVSAHNPRSLRALLASLGDLGWREPDDYEVVAVRFGTEVRVRQG